MKFPIKTADKSMVPGTNCEYVKRWALGDVRIVKRCAMRVTHYVSHFATD
ncbi:MAG: hypothetical protein HQ596_01055 [Candidatus Saganbacteria bacterium]|nr:hypothetical protein [Candidatus Saganbacteria bacterium]